MQMKNTVYLIDYENVSYKGLYGISEVKKDDEIIVFYSNDISIIQDIISIYSEYGVIIKYFKLDKTGKNALDFMVSAYAGYVSSKENIGKIAILSNDKGYSSVEMIIKSVNPEIELLFENCIFDVNHPEYAKNSADQSSEILITLPAVSSDDRCRLNSYVQHELKNLGYSSDTANKVCKIVISHCQEEKMLNKIHNDLHTGDFDDYKQLYNDVKVIIGKISSNNTIASEEYLSDKCSNIELPDFIDIQNFKIDSEYVNIYLANHTKIPAKYISSLSGVITRHINHSSIVDEAAEDISKHFGKKEENNPYKKEALACFKHLSYIIRTIEEKKQSLNNQQTIEDVQRIESVDYNSWEAAEERLTKVLYDEIQNKHIFGIIPIVKKYFNAEDRLVLIEKEIARNYSDKDAICEKIRSVL